jgi:prevent-host-death family protein
MSTVNMHEAKSKLSSLVEKAVSGKDVIIAKAGAPMVRLVPVKRDLRPRIPGRFKGRISIAPDFNATPPDLIGSFEGESK